MFISAVAAVVVATSPSIMDVSKGGQTAGSGVRTEETANKALVCFTCTYLAAGQKTDNCSSSSSDGTTIRHARRLHNCTRNFLEIFPDDDPR